MTPEDKKYYRELHAIVSDQFIEGLIVKYATIGYNNAIEGLKTATDIRIIGYFQGKVAAYESLKGIREYVTKVLKNAQ